MQDIEFEYCVVNIILLVDLCNAIFVWPLDNMDAILIDYNNFCVVFLAFYVVYVITGNTIVKILYCYVAYVIAIANAEYVT